ncbi:hypothetical protein [Parvularcula sp. LCG005]|uniref:hypothetical protein n=1 Tax=Parvularcula sp. LCG005 TaxID=3078805 RepID=UPI0029426533|nr:hypothetical protein [Parvularcula sp. LCG005]WOI54319.1 hypothetical protein RUI03_04785 [Parvularcula sp. LCG005]
MADDPIDFNEAKRRVQAGMTPTEAVNLRRALNAIEIGKNFKGMEPGSWEPDEWGMPPHCPVVPLGRYGDNYYIFNASGGITVISGSVKETALIQDIFLPYANYAAWAWPYFRTTDNGRVYDTKKKWEGNEVIEALKCACTLKMEAFGAWDTVEKVRGRGCWRTDDNELIVHLGDKLIMPGGLFQRPTEIGGYLYPKRPSINPPSANSPAGGDDGPGQLLYAQLKSWNWKRPEIDPYLLLGWIGMAFLSGALDWRSMIYITGGRGTGKSSLLWIVKWIMGGLGLKVDNGTAPGLKRYLNNDSAGVILDEFEATTDNRRAKDIIDMAREASSEGNTVRADPNGGAVLFKVRSSFIFASILPPPLNPADVSRMAILELGALNEKDNPQPLGDWEDERFVNGIGADIFSRMVCDFPRVRRAIRAYKEALQRYGGHDGRGGDTFGTLLGCAHVIIDDDEPTEADCKNWAELLSQESLREFEMAGSEWADCLDQLLSATPQVLQRTGTPSISALLGEWRADTLRVDNEGMDDQIRLVRKRLNIVGMSIVMPKGKWSIDDASLFFPAKSAATNPLFEGTKWAGAGVAIAALRQMPSTNFTTCKQRTGAGAPKSGISIALSSIFKGEDE